MNLYVCQQTGHQKLLLIFNLNTFLNLTNVLLKVLWCAQLKPQVCHMPLISTCVQNNSHTDSPREYVLISLYCLLVPLGNNTYYLQISLKGIQIHFGSFIYLTSRNIFTGCDGCIAYPLCLLLYFSLLGKPNVSLLPFLPFHSSWSLFATSSSNYIAVLKFG